MPASLPFIEPCRPRPVKRLPTGDAWLHEPKLDGWRLQAVKRGKDVALYSRNGRDLTERYEIVAEAVRKLPCRSCVLDGELVMADEDGINFYGLRGARRNDDVSLWAFDLLELNGKDLRSLPLIDRKARLERLMRTFEAPSARHDTELRQRRGPTDRLHGPGPGRRRVQTAQCALQIGLSARVDEDQMSGLDGAEPGSVGEAARMSLGHGLILSTGKGASVLFSPNHPGSWMVAPLVPQYWHLALRLNTLLEASAPHRMMKGVSATAADRAQSLPSQQIHNQLCPWRSSPSVGTWSSRLDRQYNPHLRWPLGLIRSRIAVCRQRDRQTL